MEEKIELDIVISPEGEGRKKIYSISSIQVPNVVTQGKTVDEAKKRLKEALDLYFKDLPEQKLEIIKVSKKETNLPMISRMFL